MSYERIVCATHHGKPANHTTITEIWTDTGTDSRIFGDCAEATEYFNDAAKKGGVCHVAMLPDSTEWIPAGSSPVPYAWRRFRGSVYDLRLVVINQLRTYWSRR